VQPKSPQLTERQMMQQPDQPELLSPRRREESNTLERAFPPGRTVYPMKQELVHPRHLEESNILVQASSMRRTVCPMQQVV
jgi:hypothetical protein